MSCDAFLILHTRLRPVPACSQRRGSLRAAARAAGQLSTGLMRNLDLDLKRSTYSDSSSSILLRTTQFLLPHLLDHAAPTLLAGSSSCGGSCHLRANDDSEEDPCEPDV